MKLTVNYGRDVVVLPLTPVLARAKQATATDLALLLLLLGDPQLCADYTAEADRAAHEAGYTRAELDRALSFWQGAGVIEVEEGAPTVPETAPVAEKPRPIDIEPLPEKKLEREATVPHYTTEQLTTLLESRVEMKALIDAAQQTFGKMFTTMEVNTVIGMVDYLALEPEYILVLLAWCNAHGKHSIRYAEKTAISLHDEGIHDTESLNSYLRTRDAREQMTAQLRTLFGASGRSLSAKEKAAFARWTEVYGYDIAMITRAYEATVDAIGKASVPYTESILGRWHAEGIRTLEQVDANEAERARQREGDKPVSSFDTDAMFEDALKRSYS